MDAYEATKVVMSRIQSLDPENASKIMGYILIQDQGEKEMIRLAFGPESLLLSYISQAKACLGLVSSNSPSSNSNSNSNPSTPPLGNSLSRNFPQSSPRILVPNNGYHLSNPPSPFQRSSPRPFSYAAALNNGGGSGSPSLHFYGGGGNANGNGNGNEYQQQVQDHLSFLDDSLVDPVMSPSGRSDSLVFPYGEDSGGVPSPHHPFHRRSCSVNDAAAFLSNLEDGGGGGGFGWRPCMYFARGFCKNGSACKFLHSDINGETMEMGSPNKTAGSGFDELLRFKALQHHRFALMASGGHHPLPFGFHKGMDFLNENPRNDFSTMGLVGAANSSSSRQIYLTFPADSTFKEEDVSNYFSKFGPVQDVRIPYQQKRMFGFVTFVYPETVKLILAKGNPHFVCDSRVLVKPYKEKGKILDKKQQLERGEHSGCLSPSGMDSREQHIDAQFGNRMLFNSQEMMLRRKLEEAELQHAIELQGQRMMNLQLMDLKNQHHNNHFLPSLKAGMISSSPRQSQLLMNQNFIAASSDAIINHKEDSEEFDTGRDAAKSPSVDGTKSSAETITGGNKLPRHTSGNDSDLSESLEHILPDNLFASPTKLAAERHTTFSQASADDNNNITVTISSANNNNTTLPSSSPLGITPPKSCYLQSTPRFSSGQEAIEM